MQQDTAVAAARGDIHATLANDEPQAKKVAYLQRMAKFYRDMDQELISLEYRQAIFHLLADK